MFRKILSWFRPAAKPLPKATFYVATRRDAGFKEVRTVTEIGEGRIPETIIIKCMQHGSCRGQKDLIDASERRERVIFRSNFPGQTAVDYVLKMQGFKFGEYNESLPELRFVARVEK